ncbi:hypothetical protein DA803_01475 [[Mycoplasma] phocae]|uniref:Uncharacterized protein n=1 Tax=[Mycoplasma] phocae TaxID=142651 RepID=A0A2Z5IPZ2_9BACT|nr:hypothetical protein [[Mycoplasma] phocae]AXE60755.1 hypothetical protein DA803_01475 [[Mycoplasma] phocae]
MSYSKDKKKKKIILSVTSGIFILSTITVAALYAKYNNNRDDIIKDPKTGLTKQEEQKARRYDPNKDEEYDLLRKYLIKVINVLQKGTRNAYKELTIKDYQVGIAYLEEAINFGRGALIIVNRAIEIALKNEKKVELREDRDALNGTVREALKALELAKSKLKKLLQYQAIVNEAIENLSNALKKANEAVTIPEFEYIIREMEKLLVVSKPIEENARKMLLIEEADKLSGLINETTAKINELKGKINSQSTEQQRESVRIFAAGLSEKINRIKEKSAKAIAAVDIENLLKEVNFLIESSNGVKDLANKLGLGPEAEKIEAGLKILKEEKATLEARLTKKIQENKQLIDQNTGIINEIQNSIDNSEKATSLEELTKAVEDLEASIKKASELKPKLEKEKLSKEINELKDKITEASRKLDDLKLRKQDKEDQIKSENENLSQITSSLKRDYIAADVESRKLAGDTAALRKFKATINIGESTYNRLNADTVDFKKHIKTNLDLLKKEIDDIKNNKLGQVESNFEKNQKENSTIYLDELVRVPNIYVDNVKLESSKLRELPASNIEKFKDKLSIKYKGGDVDLDTNVKIETDYNDIVGQVFIKITAKRFSVVRERIWTYGGFEPVNRYILKNNEKLLTLSHNGGLAAINKEFESFSKFIGFLKEIKTPQERRDFLLKHGFSFKWNVNDSLMPVKLDFRISEIKDSSTGGNNKFSIVYDLELVVRNATQTTFGQSASITNIASKTQGIATITLK